MDNRIIISKEQEDEVKFWRNALRLNTSIPAIIDEFDTSTQRVSATPAVKAKITNLNGTVSYIDYPKITNIPLAIAKGDGLSITYPVKKGKLCTLIFSQRSIDNILLDGTKPTPPFEGENAYTSTLRCMDMTDAMCFPGIITNSEAISNYNNNAVELRNSDGTVKVSVEENGLTLAQGNATIEMKNDGVSIVATTISILGQTTINGKDFDTHIHSGVTGGNQNTGGVV